MSRFCFLVLEQAVPTQLLFEYREAVLPSQKAALEALKEFGLLEVAKHLPSEVTRFEPTAASINPDVSPKWRELFFAVREKIASILCETFKDPVCDLDLSWLRTQFPPDQRPLYQSPHFWHQDGACAVNFANESSYSPSDLAEMLTAWVPLEACGNAAPSIELVVDSPKRLLSPDQLQNPKAEWSKLQTHSVQLNAGDIVLMAGHCVHRTHVTQSMTKSRNCVEFRFLDRTCLPLRFSQHEFVS